LSEEGEDDGGRYRCIPSTRRLFAEASREARPPFDVRLEGAEIFFSWDNATILATKR